MAGGPVTTQTAAIWLQIPMPKKTADFSGRHVQLIRCQEGQGWMNGVMPRTTTHVP